MATKKKSLKKKTAVKKKPVVKKKKVTKKKAVKKAMAAPPGQLVTELCAPGKRCKQRSDGNFIRQNFIGGRWVQVSGTTFPTLQACKNACTG
jgi:hypothetical protein